MDFTTILILAALTVILVAIVGVECQLYALTRIEKRKYLTAKQIDDKAELGISLSNDINDRVIKQKHRLDEVDAKIAEAENVISSVSKELELLHSNIEAICDHLLVTQTWIESSEDPNDTYRRKSLTNVKDSAVEFYTRIDKNTAEHIKSKLSILCEKVEVSEDVVNTAVELLQDLCKYEDTTEFMESHPKLGQMIFGPGYTV